MLLIRKPSPEKISTFLEQQRRLEFTYRPVGFSASVAPPGFNTDHTRIPLGEGIDAFNAAKQALRNWKQFDLGWLSAWPPDTPIQDKQAIAVVAQFGLVWWLNACRIVYVIDEDCRFGFAYGTLPDHAASGQERFMIEIDQAGTVWYDIFAFSRPVHFLARLGYPIMRRVQKQFAAHSARAMRLAVGC